MSNLNKKKLKIIKFRSSQQLQKDEFREIFEEEFDKMEEAIFIWRDKEDDLWWCSTKMFTTQLVGMIELAKHWIIGNHPDVTED